MKSSPRILPVIHYLDRLTALAEVAVARRAGAHGVFLISHLGNDDELVEVAWEAKQMNGDFPVGINLLSRPADFAALAALENGLDMVWADDMGVDSHGLSALGEKLKVIRQDHPQLRFFASVAFKYRPDEPHPELAASHARAAGFTATTSGPGTGKAPEVDKIRRMSESVAGELAIASGMTPENIALFAPYLGDVLVSTGISLDEFRIDPLKLAGLIKACEVNTK